jgi:1,2-diacylglycerol 3-alpha-glucosyltransferase
MLKMKILIATDNYYPNVNGASYFAQRHAYNLQQAGQTVLVIAPSREATNETFEYQGVKIFGVRSMPLERIRVAQPLVSARAIENAVKNFKPDIIHIQSHFAVSRHVAKVAKKLKIPIIGTNHFMPENLVHYLHMPQIMSETLKRTAWNYFLKTFNTLDAVTSPTQAAADLLKSIGLKKPVQVISNGIDLRIFKPENDGAYLKPKYGISNQPVLLFVGRLDKEKNLDLIINSLVKVVDKIPLKFVIAGTGAERDSLEALVKQLGLQANVIFAGFVPDADLPNLYALASCFIIAGTAELQSIVTMEAMATGMPVIAVKAMALPELVHDNANGFLFNPGDKEKITECLIKIFSNPDLRTKMSLRGLADIKIHDTFVVTEKFLSFYNQVRGGRL